MLKFLSNTIGITMRTHSQHRIIAGNRHIISHFSSGHTVLDKRRPVRVERVSTQQQQKQRYRGATEKTTAATTTTTTTTPPGGMVRQKLQQQQQRQQRLNKKQQQQQRQLQRAQQKQQQQQQQASSLYNQDFDSFFESMGGDPMKMSRHFQDTYNEVKQGLLGNDHGGLDDGNVHGDFDDADLEKLFGEMSRAGIGQQFESMGLSLGPEFEQLKEKMSRVEKTAELMDRLERTYQYASMAELDDHLFQLSSEERALLMDEMESYARLERGEPPINGTIADMIESTEGHFSETRHHLDGMKTLRSMQDMLRVFGKEDVIKTPVTDEMLEEMTQLDNMAKLMQEQGPVSMVDRKEMAKKMDFEFESLPEEGERRQRQKVAPASFTPEDVDQIPLEDMNLISAIVKEKMAEMSPSERKEIYDAFKNQFNLSEQEIAEFKHHFGSDDQRM